MKTLRILTIPVCVLLFPTLCSAQESILGNIERCAAGGAHLAGCVPSNPQCTFNDFLTGTCPTLIASAPTPTAPVAPTTTAPDPEPTPTPVLTAPAAPSQLQDVTTGVQFSHDRILTQWYTLRLNGSYVTHVGTAVVVNGKGTIAFASPLQPGSYSVTVDACGDDTGCTRSAPLTIVR